MQRWLRFSKGVERLNLAIGRGVAWLTLVMVLIGAFNAVARYVGRFIGWNLSSNAYIELQLYLFSAVFVLGAAATLTRDGHVRVDVLYGRLSAHARTWIDLAGTCLLLLPFCVLSLIVSWPAVRSSWQILEGSPDPGGLPRYPIKSLILVEFALLIAQGVAWIIQQVARLRGVPPAEESP